MSNVDNPNGFQWTNHGKPFPGTIATFIKLATVNTAIFQNDVVREVDGATGSEEAAALEPFGTGTPGVTIPTGVALDFGPSATKTRHHVIVDKDVQYVAQDDDDTDGLVLADMGKRTNVSTGTGSTTTGFSGHEIDEATVDATETDVRDLLLLRLFPAPDNAFGPHARILVKFRSVSQSPVV